MSSKQEKPDMNYIGHLLRDSAREIRRLRRQNNELGSHVRLTERLLSLFESRPMQEPATMSQDITHLLEQEAEFIAPSTLPAKPTEIGETKG